MFPIITLHKRAFSLIESAIVLGIIGLIIGGIWIAASEVSYAQQKQKFYAGILTIQRQAQQYLTQSSPCTSTQVYSDNGGNFIVYAYPKLYAFLKPAEWSEIDTKKFVTYDYVTQIACDANGVRYYNLYLAFKTSTACAETYNALRARGLSLGRGGIAGVSNCSGSYKDFNVSFDIPRRD